MLMVACISALSIHCAVTAGPELVSRMRAGFCMLGPLLARRGRASVALPGGCRIGPRPIDLHLRGLAALGADIRIENGHVVAQAKLLRGAEVDLAGPNGPTVTGTANVLMAAVACAGETVIRGAAREPEIADLGMLLISLGARIDGLGTSTMRIRGVSTTGRRTSPCNSRPHGNRHTALGRRHHRRRCDSAELSPRSDGCRAGSAGRCGSDARHWTKLDSHWQHRDRPQPFHFTALPYPGVPTDLQAPLTALAALADGKCIISDQVFPHRFGHVTKLNALGAQIRRDRATAVVTGVDRLHGGEVTACDLRCAAALVLAGLAAGASNRHTPCRPFIPRAWKNCSSNAIHRHPRRVYFSALL